MKLTIGIKALNEERNIARSIASAVAAARPFSGRVVLADSGSTDRTIEIAKEFPIDIVRLLDPAERSCGAGAQLAFQQAVGEYFYLLDGDMALVPDFLPAAIVYLDKHPEFAAVGGRVREVNIDSYEFQIRAKTLTTDPNQLPGIVDRLDCGGLYRLSAVQEVSYFADRNLHAFEEFDLGARLQSKGWKLARIDKPAVDHYGHKTRAYGLLWQRIKCGHSGAAGEVLRGAFGHSHLPIVLRKLTHVRNSFAVLAWWALLAVCLALPITVLARLAVLLVLVVGPISFLAFRRRSIKLSLYSFIAWNVNACGLVSGLLRRRVSPMRPVASMILADHRSDDAPLVR